MAYPRVCGATKHDQVERIEDRGLSPRVRGNLVQANAAHKRDGPIPACAGQPLNPSGLSLGFWAYPRVCGATKRTYGYFSSRRGLSPRVRGNLVPLGSQRLRLGPIPACAGQPVLGR